MKYLSLRKLAIILSGFLFLLGGLLCWTYRPYIYENNIYDFHFADTISSWVCIPSATLMGWGYHKRYSFGKYILLSLIAFTIYELTVSSKFDYYDLGAQFLSAGITYLIYMIIKCYLRRNEIKNNSLNGG